MAITHEEAHRLIQFKADEALKESDRKLLEAHLDSCPDCQKYEAVTHELESTLRPLLKRKWNQYPPPVSTGRTVSSGYKKLLESIFFATRIAAMGLICIAFLFNIWQFTQSGGRGPSAPAASIPLIPTPSQQSTQTRATDQECEPLFYIVKSQDTLDGIASRFSVSMEEIKSANNLRAEKLDAAMRLSIPVCNPTPAGTPNIIRTTFTPLLGSNTLTPANSPTQ
jgi:LysM repeat protein